MPEQYSPMPQYPSAQGRPSQPQNPQGPTPPKWRPPVSFWIMGAFVLVMVIAGTAKSGFGGMLIMLGFFALITGLYSVIRKRRSWAGFPNRNVAAITAGAGVVALMAGGAIAPSTEITSDLAADVTVESPGPSALDVGPTSAAPSPTPSEQTNPANQACIEAKATQTYENEAFVCAPNSAGKLVWRTQSDVDNQLKAEAAAKEAADKAAAEKAVAQKAAAEKAAAEKAAAEKAARDRAAAEKAAADKVIADQAAAEKAAVEEQTKVQPFVQNPPAEAPASGNVVHPGSFCSGGTGVTSKGTPMVCAPGKDGRNRWQRG